MTSPFQPAAWKYHTVIGSVSSLFLVADTDGLTGGKLNYSRFRRIHGIESAAIEIPFSHHPFDCRYSNEKPFNERQFVAQSKRN
jgi:hypothetical protein